ncbi:hypothetical protein [Nostoc sp. UIC 10630]|nr:hypothetical protein [Nostoc sp. UIC 10630]
MLFNFQLKAQNQAREVLADRKNRRWATSQSLDGNGEQTKSDR